MVHGSDVVIHARPSEGKEGELISNNKHKKQKKARSVLLRQKNDAELAEETSKKKRETIHDAKKGW